jgi:hypothetical protein
VQVRKLVSEKLYMSMQVYELCSEESSDRVLTILTETDWFVEMARLPFASSPHRLGDLEPLKRTRNELCTLLDVPQFKLTPVSSFVTFGRQLTCFQAAVSSTASAPANEFGSYKGLHTRVGSKSLSSLLHCLF